MKQTFALVWGVVVAVPVVLEGDGKADMRFTTVTIITVRVQLSSREVGGDGDGDYWNCVQSHEKQ